MTHRKAEKKRKPTAGPVKIASGTGAGAVRDQNISELFRLVRISERISAQIYGMKNPQEIFKAVTDTFHQADGPYGAAISLKTDSPDHLQIVSASVPSTTLEILQKRVKLSLQKFRINLKRAAFYRSVVEEGKTVCARSPEVIRQLTGRIIAAIVVPLLKYENEHTIITPLFKEGRVIGCLSLTAPAMLEEFIPSARNLALHISKALELADETLLRTQAERAATDILESMREGVAIFDLKGRFQRVNSEFEKQSGWKRTEVKGLIASELGLIPPELDDRVRTKVMPALLRGEIMPDLEGTLVRKDGSRLHALISWCLLRDAHGVPVSLICTARDISKMRNAKRLLHGLSSTLMAIRDEEKKKLSIRLHDEVGAMAVSLSSALSIAEEEVRAGRTSEALSRIDASQKTLSRSVENLKNMAIDLQPPHFHLIGLSGALRDLVAQLGRETRLHFEFTDKLDSVRKDEARDIALYRIAQESLFNVVRHANATRAGIRLSSDDADVLMEIFDNGKGIDPARDLEKSGKIGILAMRERVETMNGKFSIQSRPGRGTQITIRMPQNPES